MFLRECPRILIEGTRPAPRCLQGGRSAGVRKDSLVGVLGYGCGPACGAQSEEEDECSQEALTVCICSWDDLSCLLRSRGICFCLLQTSSFSPQEAGFAS
eukprot:XP_027311581.1 uncharacterized protein LOC113843443 isoform X6 [Anas platyrhynchos]